MANTQDLTLLADLLTVSGANVGIGNTGTNPVQPLHVNYNGAPGGVVAKYQSNGNPWVQQSGANSSWQTGVTTKGWELYNDDTFGYRLVVQNDGDVGIGTRDPTALLHLQKTRSTISGGSSDTGAVIKLHTEAQWESGYGNNPSASTNDYLGSIEFSSGDNSNGEGVRAAIRGTVDSYYNSNSIVFETADSATAEAPEERMRILYNGNVGIGTADPNGKLTVALENSNTPAFRLSSPTSSTDFAISSYNDVNGTYVSMGVNHLFDVSGNDAVMDTNDKSAAITLDGRNNGRIQFLTNSSGIATARMTILQDGNVGIGTPNPSVALHVDGQSLITNTAYFGNTNFARWGETTGSGGVNIKPGAGSHVSIASNHSDGYANLYLNRIDVTSDITANNNRFIDFYFDGVSGVRVRGNSDKDLSFDMHGGGNFLLPSGNVGIGNTDPDRPLTITSNSGANALALRARSNDDYAFIQFWNNAGNTLRGQIYNYNGSIGFTTSNDSSAGDDLYISGSYGVGINTSTTGGASGRLTVYQDVHDAYTPTSFLDKPTMQLRHANNVNGYTGIRYSNSSGTYEWFTGAHQKTADAADFVTQGYDRQLSVYRENQRIYDTGQIVQPRQPSFMAHKTSHLSIPSSGSVEAGGWSTTHVAGGHNTGGHFNTSTGRFTVPVAGRYKFDANIMHGITSGDFQIWIVVNGNTANAVRSNSMQSTGGNWKQTTVTGLLNLSANDYISIYVRSSTAETYAMYGSNTAAFTSCNGYLLG